MNHSGIIFKSGRKSSLRASRGEGVRLLSACLFISSQKLLVFTSPHTRIVEVSIGALLCRLTGEGCTDSTSYG